jgi:hypothetical protein
MAEWTTRMAEWQLGNDDDVELGSEGTGYGPLAHCRQCRAVGQASLETMIWSREMLH